MSDEQADELSRLICARLGIEPHELQCPREKSNMTPCVARDGRLAAVADSHDRLFCVGCGTSVLRLILDEKGQVMM